MTDRKKADSLLFQFAVISDTHIRLPNATDEGGYASNRLSIERAKYVVRCINHHQPSFVIHLGDVVHPIPALSNHEEAVAKASEIFSEIEAKLFVLPGNHDIGDKPNAWLPAPVIEEESHLIFSKHWGALYKAFSNNTCHFICLDTPIINSGFKREGEQFAWLENEFQTAKENGLRIFVFMHYPLFICDPNEPTHYDNIDEPARSLILELFKRYGVEAVFSGHVHNPFVGIHKKTTYYSLPSTAFVRPEYSELATVSPGDEFGRNDSAKLGFFMVSVYPDRHEILPIRTYGAGDLENGMPPVEPYKMAGGRSPMFGVSLRRGWGRRIELAADGLDEFKRKEAYRDWLLYALLELGVTSLRVPIADLENADVRLRLSDFTKMGFEFTVYSLGIPDKDILTTMETHGSLIVNWEIIFPKHMLSQIDIAVKDAQTAFFGQIFIAPVVPIKEDDGDGKTFQHFASHGFSFEDAAKAEKLLSAIDNSTDEIGLTFRVSPWDVPGDTLHKIDQQSQRIKLINLQLPRLDEGVIFEDDQQLQSFILEAYQASLAMENTTVFLDTFIDSDRGYYPRIGLVDRRFNPRPAFYALKLASIGNHPT
ncbi:MAG: metallophosphoesterase [Anaerolineales bacterium]|uniref:Metallophosphoesterase n=1 Tax=Candidatus Desulfolinea nitratireducens TaxID=2841698 RepID=A0A8J6NN96_9CHLR|nr:metallophosphoesterase [Candidatus Desulfolinea nitratireducens]MBL6961308.1 metallophosphoesterase [Anaerolineales bacterium]